MYMVTPTEAGINFNDLNGLVDVNFVNGVVGATDYTADLQLDYGTAYNPILFKGAVSADVDADSHRMVDAAADAAVVTAIVTAANNAGAAYCRCRYSQVAAVPPMLRHVQTLT